MQDNNYSYNVGDIFPRSGYDVSKERIAELAGSDNLRGRAVIEIIPDEVTEETVEEKPRKKKGRGKNADSDMSED
ncbi:hypothetical protein [Ruminococcus sp.]|uniref:hypothetical protein n=1 Tax=Ruminococcus sp. TaxID=41978 RepID=UPI001B66A88E|nr:hypothetical protein [Ruminococcus sp.]MBP5434054.1 hypothetical protein [Ruminococcus sp.]